MDIMVSAVNRYVAVLLINNVIMWLVNVHVYQERWEFIVMKVSTLKPVLRGHLLDKENVTFRTMKMWPYKTDNLLKEV
jgi:hypothetical protein